MLSERIHPILLVEDEPDDASFVRRALKKSNIVNELIVCTTSAEAREYLGGSTAETRPVLAIVDIYLPKGETGIDFLAWLRQQAPPLGETPVMVFTGSTRLDHKVEAAALRSVIFLTKPVTEEMMSASVQALGFVIVTMTAGGPTARVIEPR